MLDSLVPIAKKAGELELARQKFRVWLRDNFELISGELKTLIKKGTREDEPRIKLMLALLDKIEPTRRGVVDEGQAKGPQAPQIVINNLQRVLPESRQAEIIDTVSHKLD